MKYKLAVLLLLLWMAFASLANRVRPKNQFQVIVCDVGQGHAVLLQQASWQVLVDAGPDERVLDCLQQYMPGNDKQLEWAVATHPDLDHVNGFVSILQRYRVVNWGWTEWPESNQLIGILGQLLDKTETHKVKLVAGQAIMAPVEIQVLWPTLAYLSADRAGDTNQASIVLLVKQADFSMLLTGDADQFVQQRLATLADNPSLFAGQLPHHGSKTGFTADFWLRSGVEFVTVSVGKDNSYGHPDKDLLQQLANKGINVYRTDLCRDIRITIKQQSASVKTRCHH